MNTEQSTTPDIAAKFAARAPALSQDRDSWLAGYRAGLTGSKQPAPWEVDGLSWFSGKIEGITHIKNPPPVTLEDDAALSGKGFHWLAGAWSVAGALDLMASELPKVKPSAVVLQKTFEDDGLETFQIWSPSA
jgi:hypothetical protein